MHRVVCPQCGSEHDIEEMEPSFLRPDAYLEIPENERDFRTLASKDDCRIRTLNDTERRYFLRALVPFSVHGSSTPCSWGIWFEVMEHHFKRAQDLWDSSTQHLEPPFPCTIANRLPGYSKTHEIKALMSLTDPMNIPKCMLVEPADHPFVLEQQVGVSPERVMEWQLSIRHPETLPVFIK